ncbi:MAG TPA: hypothetical protein VN668_07220 [Stellaceae bacterium]|nr:hypothetical protein [Stellaceae bacterium]
MAETMIREAVAAFTDAEALKAAVSELQSSGFNRADISFLAREGFEGHLKKDYSDMRRVEDDPAAPRDPVIDETDIRQRRTLDISLATLIAGFAAAGFTVMTGGATLVAAGVTAAAMAGVGGATALIGKAYREGHQNFLQEQLDRGGILLWVRTPDAAAEARAKEILERRAGHDVHTHEVPVPG